MQEAIAAVQAFVSEPWVQTAFWFVVLTAVTFTAARIAARVTSHLLRRDETPLPSSSILVNIVRATVWIVGGSAILNTCFGVNIDAVVTSLGVVGIAVSLGFQDTLSNLIGGLQVTFMKIVKPGDNIEVGAESGIVRDVGWRHTTITNTRGETVVIPNSVISTTALVHLPPATQVVVPFAVVSDERPMDEIASEIFELARAAAEKVAVVEQEPKVFFSEITEYGFKGKIFMYVDDPLKVAATVDAVIRAIAPVTR